MAGAADIPKITPGSSLRPPLIGYVQLTPGELRPVTGFVGANVVGEALEGVTAFAPPGNAYVLFKSGIARLDASGIGSTTPIPGALAGFDRVVFSPSGQSALLIEASHRIQVITGLPDQPQIVREIDLSTISGTLAASAVTDDAQLLMTAFSSGEITRLEEFRTGEFTWRTVVELPSISALRYVPQSHAAILADARSNQVLLVSEDGATPAVLAGVAEGVNAPMDIETSAGGRFVFVANAGGDLLLIDRTTRRGMALACGFAAFSFQKLIRSALAVVGREGSEVAVLDTDAATPWAAYAPKVR